MDWFFDLPEFNDFLVPRFKDRFGKWDSRDQKAMVPFEFPVKSYPN